MMRKQSTNGTQTKKFGSLLALLSFTAYMPISCVQSFAADMVGANVLPDLNKAVNGSVSKSGNTMNVSVNGGKGTVGQFDWNTFNVGRNSTVNWVFNANNQTALNRVLSSGGMSYIYGKLTESSGKGCPACINTSKVILINPSGVLFGNGSSVNLNSFTTSTFDVKGAKDLKNLSASDLKTYGGTITSDSGENGTLFNIAGYNKTVEFVANENMVDGNGYLKADATGTKLASIVADGSNIYANKTVAMIGNKIDIKNNTKVTTTYTSASPNASGGTQTRSNVRLVTGDGVNFYYTSNGNIENGGTFKAATKKSSETKGISIANSEIRTGDFVAYNGVADKGSINISNSKVYTKKLIGTKTSKYTAEQTGTNGNLVIKSKGTTTITKSDVQTTNDAVNGKNVSNGVQGGKMTIAGNNGVTITNSQVRTADATGNTGSAGKISISSENGNVNITQNIKASDFGTTYDNIGIVSAGDMFIGSGKKDVNITGYDKIQAQGVQSISGDKEGRTLDVQGANVNYKNTTVAAKNIYTYADTKVTSTGSTITATNDVDLVGTNTTIDNSLLQYKNLTFYDDATTNNVTIKNNTTFNDFDTTALTLKTNGSLTLDNATLKKQEYGSTTKSNQKGITLESTKSYVAVKNGSNVVSDADITVKAKTAAVVRGTSSKGSTLNAKGKATLTAGTYIATDNKSEIKATGNVAATAGSYVDMKTGSKITAGGTANVTSGTYTNLEGSSINATSSTATVKAGTNVYVKDGSAINGKTVNVTGGTDVQVTDSGAIYAKGGNLNVTATNGKITAKSSDANKTAKIVAEGGSAKLTQKSDMNLNSDFGNSLVGGTTKLTLKSTGGSVTGNNLVNGKETIGTYKDVAILSDTSKNARYTLSNNAEVQAEKNINIGSNKDLIITNLTTNAKGTAKISSTGNLKINGLNVDGGTKTTLEGKTITTPSGKINAKNHKVALNSTGNINVNVSGMSNADNGLEVNAEVNTGVKDNNKYSQEALKGRTVTINAGDETLAVSKIKADKLTIKAKDITKGKTTVTNDLDNLGYVKADGTLEQKISINATNNKRGYIEVRTDGGFNLDPTDTYNDANKNIYTGANVSSTTTTKKENVGDQYSKVTNTDVKKDVTKNSEKISSKTEKVKETGRKEASKVKDGDERLVDTRTSEEHILDDDGTVIGNRYTTVDTYEQDYKVTDNVTYSTKVTDTYKDTETTKTTTTTETTTYQNYKTTTDKRDRQHVATLNDSEKDGFVLVYGKNTQTVKNGTDVVGKKSDTKVDTKTVVTNEARKVVTDGKPVTEKETRKVTDTYDKTRTNDVPCEDEDTLNINTGNDDDTPSWARRRGR